MTWARAPIEPTMDAIVLSINIRSAADAIQYAAEQQ